MLNVFAVIRSDRVKRLGHSLWFTFAFLTNCLHSSPSCKLP